MTNAPWTWQRRIVLAAALFVIVLGLFAALDAPHYTYTGYSRTGGNITKVDDGSPAAAAGLRPGDMLDSVSGIPRSEIFDLEHGLATGETWRVAVRRNGANLTLSLTPTGQPATELRRARSRSLLGLSLVSFTVWAFMAAPGTATLLLAIGGLAFGFLTMGAPYLAPGIVWQALNAVATLAVPAGMVVLVHFLLVFPSRDRFLERRRARWLLYGPAIATALPSVGNVVLPASWRLNVRVLGALWTVLLSAYVLWATVLLVRRYVATPRAERRTHGLGLILGGMLAAVVPLLFFLVAPRLWPGIAGAANAYFRYAAATFSVVPLTFAVAAVRSARSGRMTETGS